MADTWAPPVRDTAPTRAAGVAAAVAAALAVIAAGLWVWLPESTVVANWGLAWAGFDVLVAAAALSTAVLLRRGDVRAPLAAAAVSAMLVADAWFDVTTSGGSGLAIVEAVVVELPLAVAAALCASRVLRRSVGPEGTDARSRAGSREVVTAGVPVS